ncbi:DUF6325 family protein [Arthrobacter liuii]|uniref:DUF1269 domain-containing protein n=1 Tax=Arthrobacter liuii TaxID=1476996 RepID=A0ABQ2AD03_9MICC|nr:DUF6325 family protein [Arthrobacter liuii]GGH90017.1 hypothetical protein GCM10007170_02800 [Arthrobacter liuii]
MTSTHETEVHGPVDFVLLEFPIAGLTGRASQELARLVEEGVIRLFDLLVVAKNEDGTVEVLELTDPGGPANEFSYFEGAQSGLLGQEEIVEAADAILPGRLAVLVVYENIWAAPFVAAARDGGGELVASMRIPAPDVMAALESLEAAPPVS